MNRGRAEKRTGEGHQSTCIFIDKEELTNETERRSQSSLKKPGECGIPEAMREKKIP